MRRPVLLLITCCGCMLPLHTAWSQLGSDAAKHDVRVKRILDRAEILYDIDKDGDFVVVFDMGEGRSQRAFITSATSIYRNFEIREIWSVGYAASDDSFPASIANKLLEDTGTKKLGAWSRAGKLAVFSVRISADADDESLISAIQATLSSADDMERDLTGEDEY